MNTAISMDGVLRGDTGDLIIDGLMVYRAFKVLGRVTLFTAIPRSMAEVWLIMHGMSDFDDLLDGTVRIDPKEPLRYRQIAVTRANGPINMYIDADPSVVAEAMRLGIPTMLYSSPQYVRPEFRPDAPKGVRKWDDLVNERSRQQAMKAVDPRLKDEEFSTFE
jgi:hypothetical protein